MTILSARHPFRRIRIRSLGVLATLAANAACAAGPGRAKREESRQLTCPLERVGNAKNFGVRAVDVFAYRVPAERGRWGGSEMLKSLNPGESAEFVLADSVLLTWSDPTAETNPHRSSNVHVHAANAVQVTYSCRRFGEGPPPPRAGE